MSDKKQTDYTSRFSIGEPIYFVVGKNHMPGYIRAITFTNAKVRYAVYLKDVKSSIHNVDSCLIEDRKGDSVNFEFDNYS